MTTIPVTLILAAAVIVGAKLGLNYLRGVHSKPTLIGAHLILGVLALEQMAMLRSATLNADKPGDPYYGGLTVFLLFATLLAGLIAALIRHQPRGSNVALASHVAIATASVLAYLTWISHL